MTAYINGDSFEFDVTDEGDLCDCYIVVMGNKIRISNDNFWAICEAAKFDYDQAIYNFKRECKGGLEKW